jgi:hypothetical protein
VRYFAALLHESLWLDTAHTEPPSSAIGITAFHMERDTTEARPGL